MIDKKVERGRTNGASEPYANKIVLVTGGGAGIGRATAIAFAMRGATIVLSDIDAHALASTRDEIETLGRRCETFLADVGDEAAMKLLAEDIERAVGVPHVVVNNAGVGFLGPFLKSSVDHWQRLFSINVFGVVYGCRYLLPKMLAASGDRAVVIVASGASHYPPPNAAAYGASKAAVFSFAESLKMELHGSNVCVTTVCPGITNTSIVRKDDDGNGSATISPQQRARMREYYAKNGATPESVAESIFEGVQRKRELVLTGPASRLLFHLRRISLRLVRFVNVQGARRAGFH